MLPNGGNLITDTDPEKLAKALARYQPLDKASIEGVSVEEHASPDEHPNEEGRRMISLRRAMAVRDWLVEHGIPYLKVYYKGNGSLYSEGIRQEFKRRVEVELAIIPFPNPCANY